MPLTAPEAQAYQGAKYSYLGLLPLVIVGCSVVDLYMLKGQNSQGLWYEIFTIVFYLLALKMYLQCHLVDTSVSFCKNRVKNMENFDEKIEQNSLFYMEQKSNDIIQNKNVAKLNGNIDKNTNQSEKYLFPKKPPKVYCTFCSISHLPYRSRHCQKCQKCIQRYDHHCFWIGNCVGLHNHRQFYAFLLLQSITTILLSLYLFYLYENCKQIFQITFLILIFTTILFTLFSSYLFIYHTMLILTGMTTWQHMARKKITYLNYLPSGINPFSQGILKNVYKFWVKTNKQQEQYEQKVIEYERAKQMKPQCGFIDNQYYSCC